MDIRTIINNTQISFFVLPLLFVIGVHVPFLIWGQDSFIITNDNLNAEFLYAHLMNLTDNIFNLNQETVLQNIGEGMKLKYFHSPFIIVKLFFLLFDSFDAYIINSITVRFIGFIGLSLLIRDYFSIKSKLIQNTLCLSFAILPLYTIFGLSILGQPLLLWAFLNLRKGKNKLQSMFSIFLFVFYSNFQLIIPFAIFWLFIFGIFDKFKNKSLDKLYWIGLISLILISLIANYSIISTIFSNSGEQSFRLSRVYLELPSLLGAIYLFFKTLTFGELVSSLFISLPILTILLILFITKEIPKSVYLILSIILFNILIYVLTPHISIYIGEYISFFKAFGFGRFIYLNAFLFFLILIILIHDKKIDKLIIPVILTILTFNSIRNMELYYNTIGKLMGDNVHIVYDEDKLIKSLLPKSLYNNDFHVHHSAGFLSYKEFYSEELFKEISAYIGTNKNDYKIINLGIHPSISQYNGFHALGGYLPNYPISLHDKFKEINKKELNKQEYYGEKNITISNGVYMLSSELSLYCNEYCFKIMKGKKVEKLETNIEELKASKVKYIFAAVEILNSVDIGIQLEKVFENESSPYIVYLYKII